MSDTTKTRVLFVDDEPLVLQGLQRMLRPMRTEWDMAFVESGMAALNLMAESSFQVIVSDMRMPGMNGAQFLAKVQELYPQTVRLILSGHADKDLILKCVGTAHQFLSKPCEAEALRVAIKRGREFDSSVKNERIKQLIAQMDCLPSVPSVLSEIIEKLRNESCSVDDIADLIGKDIGMTAKLLKLVNSAFFGLRRQISSPSDAVSYLGIETIKSLVLAVNAFAPFTGNQGSVISVETLWSHSMEVAAVAKRIAVSESISQKQCEEIFIAGMLHDVGKLVLSANLPAEYAKVLEQTRHLGLPLHSAEETAFGANHAEIGGYLLSLWGLPPAVVDAIQFHHQPLLCQEDARLPVMAVHVADALLRGEQSGPGALDQLLDNEFMALTGNKDRLNEWKNLLHDNK